jgi:replication factor C large subunit
MFTEKYKPERLEDVIGQQEVVRTILRWFDSWKPGDKALLLHGPTGIGKTSIMQVLASQKELDFIEMNASNYRSAKQIRESIGRSVAQQSLFKRGKVFMIDEIDGLSGSADRGGISEMVKLIKDTKHPIVLTANKPYESKLRMLRKYCKMVELQKPSISDIEKHLKKIIKAEKIKIERDALRELAKLAGGDLRAAMNDLESLSYKKKITTNDIRLLSEREREISVYDALNKIFKADSIIEARRAIDEVDKAPDEMFWWIESNILREFEKPEEIATAFDALSWADVFHNRIRKTKNWRFLAYMIDFMTGGVAAAKRKKYFRRVSYHYPTMIATLGRTKRMRMEQDKQLAELAERLHCSKKKVRTEFLPYLKIF